MRRTAVADGGCASTRSVAGQARSREVRPRSISRSLIRPASPPRWSWSTRDIVGERYMTGIGKDTQLESWSMGKSLHATLSASRSRTARSHSTILRRCRNGAAQAIRAGRFVSATSCRCRVASASPARTTGGWTRRGNITITSSSTRALLTRSSIDFIAGRVRPQHRRAVSQFGSDDAGVSVRRQSRNAASST